MASSWTSNLGDGIALAAGPLLIASETRSPLLVSMAMLLQQLPWLLFGLHAGAIADRVTGSGWSSSRDLLRAVVLVALGATILTGVVNIGVVLGALFLHRHRRGLRRHRRRHVDAGAGRQQETTTASPRRACRRGSSRSTSWRARRSVPRCSRRDRAIPFGVQVVTVLLAAVLVTRIAMPPGPVRDLTDSHVRRDIAEGVRWLLDHPPVRTLALVIVTFNVTWAAGWSVLVLYSLEVVDMGPVGYGLLTSVGGRRRAGLDPRASAGSSGRVPLATLMRTCLLLEVVMHLGLAVNREAWVALVILFGFGMYAFVWGALSAAVRQRAVPTEFQGRVGSVYGVGVFGGMVLGSRLGGVIAEHWGLTAPFWFAFVGSGYHARPGLAPARAHRARGRGELRGTEPDRTGRLTGPSFPRDGCRSDGNPRVVRPHNEH